MKRTIYLLAVLLVAGAASDPLACAPRPGLTRFEFAEAHMGTRFRIVLYAADAEAARRAAAEAFARVARLDATMSDYRETSELMMACKQAAQAWVKVSPDLFRVLALSQQFARESGGAFDVTVGPAVRLWRRARRRGELPDGEQLAEARRLVGYRQLRLDAGRQAIRLARPGMLIDLGGIGKGYAADAMLAVLKARGMPRALIAAGGDVVAGDAPPGSSGWTVAVQSLAAARGAPMVRLSLAGAAVSTSGDAEQFVEIGGVRYSHIVDPRSGRARSGRCSATVVAPNGATADALATAASVLGLPRALRLIGRRPGAAAHIEEVRSGRLVTGRSAGWRKLPQAPPG